VVSVRQLEHVRVCQRECRGNSARGAGLSLNNWPFAILSEVRSTSELLISRLTQQRKQDAVVRRCKHTDGAEPMMSDQLSCHTHFTSSTSSGLGLRVTWALQRHSDTRGKARKVKLSMEWEPCPGGGKQCAG
jgi:hypothetical protein